MKNVLIILSFILSLSLSKAQNLVPNGNFEIYSQCPTSYAQIMYATGWQGSGVSTPDYYNACSSQGGGLNAPYAGSGYQKDCCGGQAYSGIISLNKSYPNQDREYLQLQLLDTLKTGTKYLTSMYASLCNNCDYAIGTLGVFFTSSTIQGGSNNSVINVPYPQVKNTILLSDTLNWVLVQDTFTLNSNAIYLTIGNFSADSSSDTIHVGGILSGGAYYYIDGVSVYDITGGACNSYWDAGYDKYVLPGDSIRLGAINTDNSMYTWQNSAGGSTYLSSTSDARPWCKPTQTTTYYVTKTCPNNNVFKDTVTVYVQQPNGIKQFVDNVAIKLFPNPNNGTMSLTYNLHTDAVMEISDLTGNLVGIYPMPATENTIQVKNNYLQNGVYFYRVICNDAVIKLGKIVIMQ